MKHQLEGRTDMQTGLVKRISHHVALPKPIAFGHFGQRTSANKSALVL